jgi:hypothetical protein
MALAGIGGTRISHPDLQISRISLGPKAHRRLRIAMGQGVAKQIGDQLTDPPSIDADGFGKSNVADEIATGVVGLQLLDHMAQHRLQRPGRSM